MNEYQKIQHARNHAQEAAREGKGADANPFEEGKYLYRFWLANYYDALGANKNSPGSHIRAESAMAV